MKHSGKPDALQRAGYVINYFKKPRERFAFLRGNFRLLVTWPLVALMVGVIGWASLIAGLEKEKNEAEQTALKEAAVLARGYAEQLGQTVEAVDQILLHVRYEWELTDGQLRLEDSKQRGLFPASSIFNIGVNDRTGKMITSTIPMRPNARDDDREYFQVQRNARDDALYIGKAAMGRSSGRNVVFFSRRLTAKDGSFAGIVRASVAPEYLTANYDNVALGRNGLMAILGTDGMLRATRIGQNEYDADHPPLKQVPQFPAQAGSMRLEGSDWFADARNRYVGWKKVQNFPLMAVTGLDERDTLGAYFKGRRDAIRQAVENTLILIAFTIIAMGLSLRLAWRKHQMELAQAAYRIATEEGNEGFYINRPIYDKNGGIVDFELVDCNENAANFYSRRREDLVGRKLSQFYSGGQREQAMKRCRLAMERGVFEDDMEIVNRRAKVSRWFHLKMVRSADVLAVTMRDITESKEHVLALERKGNEDALTGLPNRHWLNAYLPEAVKQVAVGSDMLALLFIDLDGFKAVNDTLGHDAGDELLRNAGRRLKLAVRPHDHVVRIGGDEFVVIIERMAYKTDAAHVAERVLQAFSEGFKLSKGVFSVGTSIGISVYPDDGADAETLLKHADIAMYSVKTEGKRNYRFFDQKFYEAVRARHDKEAELRHALEHDQLVMYYQPRVDIWSGMTCSMEALVRWAHPTKGLIEPLEFIPLAEENGLVLRLGEIVIDKVCAQIAYWAQSGQELVPVSINVSPRQFNETNVAEVLQQAFKRHKIDPRLVEIELTESSMAGDTREVAESLNAIQRMGVNLSVDDFGTGYSSLSQLQRLDFDVLKVDRAFTAELEKTKEGTVFFSAIVTMAHALGMRVVAEGVETLGQIKKLKELHCDEIQGFYISKPLAPMETQPILPRWFFPSAV